MVSFGLQKEGNESLSALGIQGPVVHAVEFLSISAVLPLCPNKHLKGARQHEKHASDSLSHKIKAKPGQDLVGIVWA